MASGAGGLQLALAALGVGPGDEVIVPAFTAVPTASAVCAVGARPVPVDVDERTAALDPAAVAAAVTPATAAIVVVHLYGRPADVEPLLALGIPVVEDAAQAHGALRRITGAAAIYSFYPTKNVGGIGDGGAVVTRDADLATTIRRLRAHGMAEQYVHVDISQNHRMSELEAAWLRLQLPALSRRQRAAGGDRPALPRGRAASCAGTPTTPTTSSTSACCAPPTATPSARALADARRGDRRPLPARHHPAAGLPAPRRPPPARAPRRGRPSACRCRASPS